MKITNFEVKERKLNKLNSVTYNGDLNVDTFRFDFDEEWINLEKTLVIISDKTTYNVPLLNDEAILPNEVYLENQSIGIGVFGRNENTILSSNLINIWINKGAYSEGKIPSNLPTSTQWDLYISEINNLLNESKTSEAECKRVLSEVGKYRTEIQDIVNTFEKNVEDKTTNFDSYVTEKMKEFKEFSDGITVITSGTDDLIEGVSELPAGSMYLVYEADEDEADEDEVN